MAMTIADVTKFREQEEEKIKKAIFQEEHVEDINSNLEEIILLK